MCKAIFLLSLLLLLILNVSTSADQMAIWDFGPNAAGYTETVTTENVTGTPTLLVTDGDKDNDGKDGRSYMDAAGTVHAKGQAAAWDDIRVGGVPDARWIMTINTTGWENMSIRWDYKAWEPETTSFDLDYRLDTSGAWTDILDNESITSDEAYHSFSYNLSSIAAIENQSIVQFTFYDIDDPDGNGKFAFDNLELTGTVIPEPATLLLLGFGAVMLRRKR